MDDDIEIEEHDVLENPLIKTIFPDISVIKKEITQYFEEELGIQEESEVSKIRYQQLSTGLQSKNNAHVNHFQDDTSLKPQFLTESSLQNKHAKPVIQSNQIILDSKLDDVAKNARKSILIGSKPSTDALNPIENVGNKTTIYAEGVTFKHVKLVIQDIKSYLYKNERYCKLCSRLFLTKKALDVHKNKVHTKVYKNKTNAKNEKKCTRRKTTSETRHRCKICGSYFSCSGNLCRHYRNIHKSKKGDICASTIATNAETQHSIITFDKNKINKKKKTNEKKHINTKHAIQSTNRCNICNIRFKTYYSLKRHDTLKHKTKITLQATNAKSKEVALGILQDTVTSLDNYVVASADKKRKLVESNRAINNTSIRNNVNVSIVNKRRKEESADINVTSVTEKLKPTSRDRSETVSLKETPKQEIILGKKYVYNKNISTKDFKLKLNDNKAEIADKKQETKEKYKEEAIEEDHKSKYIPRANNSSSNDTNLCHHCSKIFPDQKSLIDHMYEVLEPKKNSSDTKKNEYDKILFVCPLCSYYLPSIDLYYKHMMTNHKTKKNMDVKKEEFDSQCKYCPFISSSITVHNDHVQSNHINLMFFGIDNDTKDQSKNCVTLGNKLLSEFGRFALESVLFECNKCSICFLSSNIAKDHKGHIELLINWKCSVCQRFFKEHDKGMHIKQHTLSESLKVHNLSETALSYVLYNCTKCAIHFTEKRYQDHYPNCESETTDSSYCNNCDILVDTMEINHHKTQHELMEDGLDFTIIDANVMVDAVTSLTRKCTDSDSGIRPRKRLYEQHNCLTYCPTCKCFLSDLGVKNKSHIKGTCSRTIKYACDLCGLVFTNSVLTVHKERHEREKTLRLQDYKFFDLQGKQVRPPIPEYHKCKICAIHFLHKNAIRSHSCEETDFLTCDICNIKLTETAFKLHMSFHFYVIQKTSSQNDSYDSGPDQSSKDISYSKHETEEISKTTNAKDKTHHGSVIPTKNIKIPKSITHCLLKKSELLESLKSSENLHDKSKLSETITGPAEIIPNSIDQNNAIEKLNTEQIPNINDTITLLYTCKTCSVSVESYDEVIKHCQTHYSDKGTQIISVKKCKQCSLNFDRRFFMDHQRVHSGVSKIQVLKFDPCYFTSKNMIWTRHIFHTMPENLVNKLLDQSIYQHEHRIKFECVQNGSSHINVYKCNKCGNFIDPGCVYKHAENPCSKGIKYPCSFCGLPFISNLSRDSHEKLHNGKYGLTKKSLNIVLFNQSKDQIFNKRIFCTTNQYILYQCRNCDGIAEKAILTKHVCDRNTLVKCITCGLLLSNADLEDHLSKHRDLRNFYSENFKVILFGSKNRLIMDKELCKTIAPSFSGTVYDYSLYKCQICQICIKNNANIEKHVCTPNFDLDRSMCFECDVYFPSGSLKHHMKQHMTDPDFIKENINVITFLAQKNTSHELIHKKMSVGYNNICDDEKNTYGKNFNENTENNIDDINLGSVNHNIDVNIANSHLNNTNETMNAIKSDEESIVSNFTYEGVDDGKEQSVEDGEDYSDVNSQGSSSHYDMVECVNDIIVEEDPGTLYKCACGLHFINKRKVSEHIKKCQPKIKQYKEICSKCHLLFNPRELFSHLVIHHKDKTQGHNFKVIEIAIDDLKN